MKYYLILWKWLSPQRQCFLSQSSPLSSSPALGLGSTKPQELSVQGSLLSDTPPHLCWSTLPWTGALFHGGKWNREWSALFPVLDIWLHHCNKWLKSWPWLSLLFVLIQLLWQLMASSASYSSAKLLAHYFTTDQTQKDGFLFTDENWRLWGVTCSRSFS